MATDPTKFYPQPNTYYVSGAIESDVSIRSTYADSFDGSGSTITINISNLLNERYEKPATYSQDGRQFKIGFKRLF